jgi:formate-dependent nitrite reductase membrane component NrfD
MLKQPVWKWEIASYFYLGGLSAGAYVLSRAAERFGGERHRDAARIGSYVALASLLPCPPLLIHDLGDPKRFHHMLRVWKPSSPMNFGTWAITAYGPMAAIEAVRQYLNERDTHLDDAQRSTLSKLMNNGVVLLLHDLAGVPFAIAVAGYTGVLLSCTSNPLWCKNPFLGPLFSASAISTGAEAISLALDVVGKGEASQSILKLTDTVAHAAELALMSGFIRFAGEKGETLESGKYSGHHKLARTAIAAAEVLKWLPVPRRAERPMRMAANALGLAAGFALRWSMVFGGHEAAADPHTARLVSRPQDPATRTPSKTTPASPRVGNRGRQM